MDRQRLDTAVLSLSPRGVAFGAQPLGGHSARPVNEATAAEIAAAPCGRFAGLAVLPLPDVDRALSELYHAQDVPGLSGVVLLSKVLGHYPGAAGWAPLLNELHRREAYVLLHPTEPPYQPTVAERPAWVYESPFETTRAVASCISAGARHALARYPPAASTRSMHAHDGAALLRPGRTSPAIAA